MNPSSPEQLLLDFPLSPIFTWESWVESPRNQPALAAVQGLEEQRAVGLTLVGKEGAGKSHLLQATVLAWRTRHDPRAAVYFTSSGMAQALSHQGEKALALFLSQQVGRQLVVLDDLDAVVEWPALQEGLLYLYNGLSTAGGRLLCAGRHSPATMEIRADLRSRLLWGPVVLLEPPGDEELLAILAKLARDRAIRLSPDLIHFLYLRLPRRVADYVQALSALDRAGLVQQRPLTVPLAKEVLGL